MGATVVERLRTGSDRGNFEFRCTGRRGLRLDLW
jgi:hypothetical protein